MIWQDGGMVSEGQVMQDETIQISWGPGQKDHYKPCRELDYILC